MCATFFSFWHSRDQWGVGANGTVGGAVGRVVALERGDSELEPTSELLIGSLLWHPAIQNSNLQA